MREDDLAWHLTATSARAQNYPSGGISQLLFKDFFPASATGKAVGEVVFRMLDEDNGGTIGFPEIQKVVIGTFQHIFLTLNRCCRLWICAMPRRLTSKFSGPSGSSTATTPSPSASTSSGTLSDKCGKYLTGWETSIILVIVRR